MNKVNIAVAMGDGIGPEIMNSVLQILHEAKANINVDTVEIGEKIYRQGCNSGISRDAWEIIQRNKVLLKAPITTPQGKGYKSLNVTLRKSLGLFANIRPVTSYYPYVFSNHRNMDMIIIRENEEDLYAGIEYQSTASTFLALKMISKAGCEKIIRYAFEYAMLYNRKKVTCISKDNIMKLTDGKFHMIFNEVAREYPRLQADHYIVDIGAARIATRPENFDVIVTLNLYGDIISDIAAEISGSVGLAGSSNIGSKYAMFEAVHGSAPDIAGQNIANPSGLLNAAIMLLDYIGQPNISTLIRNAWLKTIEDGIHTTDIFNDKSSKMKVSTEEFTKAVINNLGQKPTKLLPAIEKKASRISIAQIKTEPVISELEGVDVYINDTEQNVLDIAANMKSINHKLVLRTISQRGLIVWPVFEVEEVSNTMLRLRFMRNSINDVIGYSDIIDLQKAIIDKSLNIVLIHNLYNYNGVIGFTKSQGE